MSVRTYEVVDCDYVEHAFTDMAASKHTLFISCLKQLDEKDRLAREPLQVLIVLLKLSF